MVNPLNSWALERVSWLDTPFGFLPYFYFDNSNLPFTRYATISSTSSPIFNVT